MAILSITNWTDHTLTFLNTESSRDNRRIAPHTSEPIGGAWVPWCTRESDFPAHHFRIVDDETEQTLWYIWQRNHRDDGDLIRCTSYGWDNPGTPIKGKPGTAGNRQLIVTVEGVVAENVG